MRTIIDNPPPLNAYRAFPYKVSAFPAAWLLKFTSLGAIPTPAPQPSQLPNSNLPNSLESWT